MIRNVVLGRLREPGNEADERQLAESLAAIAKLRLPGQLAMSVGQDAGLRAGGWSFAIVNDWTDAAAYANYDADDEHGIYRRAIGAVCADIARVQYEV